MSDALSLQDRLQSRGFAVVMDLVSPSMVAALVALFESADLDRATRGGETFGARNLLGFPLVQELASSAVVADHLQPLLGPDFRAVRGLFFDKTQEANWPVLWHQDLSVAVLRRREITGWTNWSIKRGVLHVQPPAAVLAKMVTMRLHLDDCDGDNGPLRVIAKSHADGILDRDAIRARVATGLDQAVLVKAGDALFMCPLILHASSPAIRPRHRRVLHLEFAPAGLIPAELEWAEA